VLFNSKNWGPPGNGAYYKNAKVDELTDRAKTMVQSAARNSLYKQAESIILEDAPWAPIYFYTSWAIKQPYVEGFTFSGMGPFTVALEKVWLNK
jgi:peptide/nickel transport system substrate-binding protein/oligopeptide transport system substrate-binding protein